MTQTFGPEADTLCEDKVFRWGFLFIAFFCMAGCVSSGQLLSSMGEQQGYHTLATFARSCQAAPAVLEYTLVDTPKGKGILEWDTRSKKGFVAYYGWEDEKGEHYISWVEFLGRDALAVEYIVPHDTQRPILAYQYKAGTYAVVESNGVRKPVPQGHPPVTFTLARCDNNPIHY